jgi:hypothetical protein
MANAWNNKIIVLDTQNDDDSYNPANDAKVISTGVKYDTSLLYIEKVNVKMGDTAGVVTLRQCSESAINGVPFLDLGTLLANENVERLFNGFLVAGINPSAIPANAKVYIFTK